MNTRSDDVRHVMPSSQLDKINTVELRLAWKAFIALKKHTQGRTMSGIYINNHPCIEYIVGRRQEWHVIISLGQHTRSDYVSFCSAITPLGSTYNLTRKGVKCDHCTWKIYMVELHWVWHVIITLGKYTRSDDVGRYRLSLPLEIRNNRMMSGVACHHRPCYEHTVGWCQACHAIIAIVQHTHGRTTSGVDGLRRP